MLLHFIFVIKKQDYGKRDVEFQYIKEMAQFYKKWIHDNFKISFDIQCDQMVTTPRSIIQRLDTAHLVRDHSSRGDDIYHFYLSHFRPFWTDCTCEGYHAENFGMIWWKQDKDTMILAEKNCTVVSHELTHELLRRKKYKRYTQDVHDVWTRHFFDGLPFIQYDKDYNKTESKPKFLTMDISSFNTL